MFIFHGNVYKLSPFRDSVGFYVKFVLDQRCTYVGSRERAMSPQVPTTRQLHGWLIRNVSNKQEGLLKLLSFLPQQFVNNHIDGVT